MTLENTQPFERELGARIHTFAHNGHLPDVTGDAKYHSPYFRPVGNTDSETVFCYLLERMRDLWEGSAAPDFELRWQVFRDVCAELRSHGPANFLYSDSDYLFAHGNQRTQDDGERRPPGLHWLCRQCSRKHDSGLASDAIAVKNAVLADSDRQSVVLIASVPLTDEHWEAMADGEMLAARRGEIVARALP